MAVKPAGTCGAGRGPARCARAARRRSTALGAIGSIGRSSERNGSTASGIVASVVGAPEGGLGPHEQGLGGGGGPAEQLGHLGHRQGVQVAQRERGPVVRTEGAQHLVGAVGVEVAVPRSSSSTISDSTARNRRSSRPCRRQWSTSLCRATPTSHATLICGTASRCTALTAARKVSAVRSSAVARFEHQGGGTRRPPGRRGRRWRAGPPQDPRRPPPVGSRTHHRPTSPSSDGPVDGNPRCATMRGRDRHRGLDPARRRRVVDHHRALPRAGEPAVRGAVPAGHRRLGAGVGPLRPAARAVELGGGALLVLLLARLARPVDLRGPGGRRAETLRPGGGARRSAGGSTRSDPR